MMKGTRQANDGDKVVLLVGDYDPPTMDYLRAIEALQLEKGVDHVWACPVKSEDKERARLLTMSFCAEVASRKKPVTCCTVGLDRDLDPDGLASWCRQRYATFRFETVSVSDVKFAGEEGDGVKVSKFLRVGDVRDRIGSGYDESRSFTPGTWSLIQARKYYR